MCACVSVAVLLVRTAPSRTRGGVFFFVLFFVVIVVVFPLFFLRCSPSCCVQLRTLHVIEHVCVYLIALKVAT